MTRGQPVSRRGAAAGLALFLAGVAAVVLVGTALEHPRPGARQAGLGTAAPADPATEPPLEPAGDPRVGVSCPGPPPREGEQRAPLPPPADAALVTARQLLACPNDFDGRLVHYRGEVVGGLMRRAGGVWTQLNQTAQQAGSGAAPAVPGIGFGLGALLPHGLAALVDDIGGPGHRGDVLDVLATFHRVDADTGEVAVLRVSSGNVATDGGAFAVADLPDRRIAAFVALALAAAATVAERLVARRR